MIPTNLSRAELLRILTRLPEAEWVAAAHAAGYEPLPARSEPGPVSGSSLRRSSDGDLSRRADRGQPAAYAPADLPDLPFWSIVAERRLTSREQADNAPPWLAGTRPWRRLPLAETIRPVPLPAELTPPARRARFLRQVLATPTPGRSLDIPRLCRQLAEGRIAPHLPRRRRPRWPGRVYLVIDLSAGLRPFHRDLWGWCGLAERILGRRVVRLFTRTGHPGELERADGDIGDHIAVDDGTPLIVLGDAGLYAPAGHRHRHWLALARRCARNGPRPVLLAPLPSRLLTAAAARAFQCALLERGRSPRLAYPTRIPLPMTTASKDARAGPTTQPLPPACTDLLAALADGAYTEPALLRRLRLLLKRRGADIGCEHGVWNHPAVVADELACALRPAQRVELGAHLETLPADLRRAIARAREEGNAHLSPLVRWEETLAAGPRADPRAYGEALVKVQGWAATLLKTDRASLRQPLVAAIAGLGRRRSGLLAEHRELAAAWAIAHRQALDAGTLERLPAGIDLNDLGWLLSRPGQARLVYLGQQGECLGVYPGDGFHPACRLVELSIDRDYWELETPGDGSTGEVPTTEDAAADPRSQVLRLGEDLPLRPGQRYRLTVGDRRLELEAVRRPSWAAGLGRDGDGLFAELSRSADGGRRLYWMPSCRLRVTPGATPVDAGLELLVGAWWDAVLYRAWLADDRMLTVPDWAQSHGVDAAGRWAEIAVEGVVQRLRWLPPGAFLMGSPEGERQRRDNETQHQVILTRGLWLADTACTQALWQAVMGKNPSGFRGPQRPVEQVSWEDVVERFLPALNARIPGFEARLPTEAEWEYACRAGGETPFSFGETITTDQVNYDGNYPYADGPKGAYREQTVDVKALPANGWGLHQMHGNIYEWCADWFGEYPGSTDLDPTGSTAGRVRVLRGGYWNANARWCRSAYRRASEPGLRSRYFGFRLARGSSPRQAKRGGGVGEAGVAPEGGAPAATPATPAPGQREEAEAGGVSITRGLNKLIHRFKKS